MRSRINWSPQSNDALNPRRSAPPRRQTELVAKTRSVRRSGTAAATLHSFAETHCMRACLVAFSSDSCSSRWTTTTSHHRCRSVGMMQARFGRSIPGTRRWLRLTAAGWVFLMPGVNGAGVSCCILTHQNHGRTPLPRVALPCSSDGRSSPLFGRSSQRLPLLWASCCHSKARRRPSTS